MARVPKRLVLLLLGHDRNGGDHSLVGAIAAPGVEFGLSTARTDSYSAYAAYGNACRDSLLEIGFFEVYAHGSVSCRRFKMRGNILANLIAANADSRADGYKQLLPPGSKALG
jgi:hypothetical protein